MPFWPDRPPAEAFEIAAAAERKRFDELWIGEVATFDAFALAGAIAARTKRIEITVGPLAVGVRDPVAIAMGIASVATIGARPARLALGASTPAVVEEWHGREWSNRVVVLRETVTALRSLLEGEKTTFHGRTVRIQGFRLRLDPPRSHMTIAASGEQTISAAAELADRVVVNLVTPTQAATLKAALALRAAATERSCPTMAAWIVAAVDPVPETLGQIRTAIVPYVGAPGYGEMFTAAGFEDVVAAARAGAHPKQLHAMIPDKMISTVCAIGDSKAVRRRIDEYREAGVDDVAIVPATAGDGVLERTLAAARRRG